MDGTKRKAFSLYDDEDDEETTPIPPKKLNDTKEEEENKEDVNNEEKVYMSNEKQCDVKAEQSCLTDCEGIEMFATAARQGERPEMEDAQIEHIKFDLGKPFVKRCALFAIFDGHAGSKASRYCEKVFAETLRKHLSSFDDLPSLEKSLKRVFTDVYKSIDETFLSNAKKEKPMWKDGTTVTSVLFLNNSIYVANIGDSRAIVCRQKKEEKAVTIQLTIDHNPSVYEERVRIQKAGGFVKDGRINGSIEVSRSIGDINFKRLGVISVPDVKKLTITDDDKLLVIACDGLWKVFPNDDVPRFIELQLNKEKNITDVTTVDQETLEGLAAKLASEAVRRQCGDNVSVILVKLSKF